MQLRATVFLFRWHTSSSAFEGPPSTHTTNSGILSLFNLRTTIRSTLVTTVTVIHGGTERTERSVGGTERGDEHLLNLDGTGQNFVSIYRKFSTARNNMTTLDNNYSNSHFANNLVRCMYSRIITGAV